jgi:hypothetical protein
MNNIGTLLSVLALALSACMHTSAQTQSCVSLLKQDARARRNFLVSQEPTRSSPCITSVIKSLKAGSAEETIHILIRYLDYMDPESAPIPGVGASRRPDFPAIAVLFEIGKPAIPSLLSAIEDSDSETVQRNASLTYSFIYRDDLADGIRNLQQEQATASVRGHSRLSNVIQMLSGFCKNRTRDEALKCDKALRGVPK